MNVLDIMKSPTAYASGFENIPVNEQRRAKSSAGSITKPLQMNRKSVGRFCKNFWAPAIL